MKRTLMISALLSMTTSVALANSDSENKFFVAYQVAQSSNLPNTIRERVLADDMLDRIAIEAFKQMGAQQNIQNYQNNPQFKAKVRGVVQQYLNSSAATNIYDDAATKIYNQTYTLDQLKAQYRVNRTALGQDFLSNNVQTHQEMKNSLKDLEAKYYNAAFDQQLEVAVQQNLQKLVTPKVAEVVEAKASEQSQTEQLSQETLVISERPAQSSQAVATQATDTAQVEVTQTSVTPSNVAQAEVQAAGAQQSENQQTENQQAATQQVASAQPSEIDAPLSEAIAESQVVEQATLSVAQPVAATVGLSSSATTPVNAPQVEVAQINATPSTNNVAQTQAQPVVNQEADPQQIATEQTISAQPSEIDASLSEEVAENQAVEPATVSAASNDATLANTAQVEVAQTSIAPSNVAQTEAQSVVSQEANPQQTVTEQAISAQPAEIDAPLSEAMAESQAVEQTTLSVTQPVAAAIGLSSTTTTPTNAPQVEVAQTSVVPSNVVQVEAQPVVSQEADPQQTATEQVISAQPSEIDAPLSEAIAESQAVEPTTLSATQPVAAAVDLSSTTATPTNAPQVEVAQTSVVPNNVVQEEAQPVVNQEVDPQQTANTQAASAQPSEIDAPLSEAVAETQAVEPTAVSAVSNGATQVETEQDVANETSSAVEQKSAARGDGEAQPSETENATE